MGLTFVKYPGAEEDGISIIKHAFSKGITFFDTSDIYGTDHANEILVGKVRTTDNVDIFDHNSTPA